MNKQMEKNLSSNKGLELMLISAKTGLNLQNLMDKVIISYDKWNTRISTGLLNDWLNRFKKVEKMPTENGEILNIKFVSQIKSRPPTFVVFVNNSDLLKENYLRFLKANLCKEFNLTGTTTRIIVKDKNTKKPNSEE
jgi:GTP-binding protein